VAGVPIFDVSDRLADWLDSRPGSRTVNRLVGGVARYPQGGTIRAREDPVAIGQASENATGLGQSGGAGVSKKLRLIFDTAISENLGGAFAMDARDVDVGMVWDLEVDFTVRSPAPEYVFAGLAVFMDTSAPEDFGGLVGVALGIALADFAFPEGRFTGDYELSAGDIFTYQAVDGPYDFNANVKAQPSGLTYANGDRLAVRVVRDLVAGTARFYAAQGTSSYYQVGDTASWDPPFAGGFAPPASINAYDPGIAVGAGGAETIDDNARVDMHWAKIDMGDTVLTMNPDTNLTGWSLGAGATVIS